MAALGSLEALVRGIKADTLAAGLLAYTREWARSLRFGAPSQDGESVVRAENMAGALVPIVTSASSGTEVAVQHKLAQTPRTLIPMLRLDMPGATLPVLTVTRAADDTNFYVSSTTTSANVLAYVE